MNRYLATLDLTRFNIIDLDSYGVPSKQLDILFRREYKGLVHFTMIQSVMGMLPNHMLFEIGFSPEIINKSPTVCMRRGWDKFKNYLANKGVKEIHYKRMALKVYGYFYL